MKQELSAKGAFIGSIPSSPRCAILRVSNPMNANATAGSSASASFRESSLRRPARWLHGARSRRRSATCRVWVITDEQIVEACKREARTIDELFMVRGMREKLNTRDARTVAGLAKKALNPVRKAGRNSTAAGATSPTWMRCSTL